MVVDKISAEEILLGLSGCCRTGEAWKLLGTGYRMVQQARPVHAIHPGVSVQAAEIAERRHKKGMLML